MKGPTEVKRAVLSLHEGSTMTEPEHLRQWLRAQGFDPEQEFSVWRDGDSYVYEQHAEIGSGHE